MAKSKPKGNGARTPKPSPRSAPIPTLEPPHLVADLTTLKLTTMASEWERQAAESRRQGQSMPEYLATLAHLEATAQQERRIQRRIKDARFPVVKTLDAFDFAAVPSLDRERVLELFRCEWVEARSNLVFLGPVGVGKTHLATALGVACCQRDYRVRFTTAAELVNDLVDAKRDGRLARKLRYLERFDVLLIDEVGYLPFDRESADLLFTLIGRLYEQRSLVLTTNLPFSRWSEIFHDATAAAAVIDRVVHHSTILKVEAKSYRLREAKASDRSSKPK